MIRHRSRKVSVWEINIYHFWDLEYGEFDIFVRKLTSPHSHTAPTRVCDFSNVGQATRPITYPQGMWNLSVGYPDTLIVLTSECAATCVDIIPLLQCIHLYLFQIAILFDAPARGMNDTSQESKNFENISTVDFRAQWAFDNYFNHMKVVPCREKVWTFRNKQ